MKIVQINATCGVGSTGKICMDISKKLTEQNVENYVFYTSSSSQYPLATKYASDAYIKSQALFSRLGGQYGFYSRSATRRLIRALQQIQPNIVHLHNLHGHNCHLGMLLDYLKTSGAQVVWTFHDCWAFTAYCPHFEIAHCNQWQTGCQKCLQYRQFSWLFDKSKTLYHRKQAVTLDQNLTIVTPSQWLADLVGQSFLKDYPVQVIHNGIDLQIFQPTPSDFREKYHIPPKKHILLGVAFDWSVRKGMDVFMELHRRLPSESYQIVLVGVDQKTEKTLPKGVISIRRTQNQRELAEIYSAADLFVNPTREDNFPTVNLEANACGTPVLTFRTGGSPECITNTSGAVVDCDDISAMEREIRRICETKPYTQETCRQSAQRFDKNEKYKEYIELYKEIAHERVTDKAT